jgi:predicted TIM-barrel fold metal-dependent hydrolase
MCLTCAMLVLPGAAEGRRASQRMLQPPVADHHLHIQSPAITAELKRRIALAPEQFVIFSPALLETRTAQHALDVLDAAGIERGVLLSMAYMFASPRATIAPADAPALTRAENEWNVEAARASGGRLQAFISVNPFADFALGELRHWAPAADVSGLKLHLGNSDFDWRSNDDVARLATIFAAARDMSLPILVHVRGGGAYSPLETRRFIDEVLIQAGDNCVQIAHGGGGGGLDEATVQALAMYAEAIDQRASGTGRMVFDLAAVLVRDSGDPPTAALLKRFAQLVRHIGPERFVMASDWPSVFAPAEHNQLLEAQIPLTADEWQVILNNRAPYLGTARQRPAEAKPR